jgi:transmembrane sensor
MVEEGEYMDDLIGKVLAGEATAQEREQVEEWLHASASNQKYFDQVKTIFAKAASNAVQQQFDTDAAWKSVKRRLKGKEVREFKIQNTAYWSVLKIAAGILIFISAGIFAYQYLTPQIETAAFVSGTTTVQDTLPDGSTAFLNKKSELSYEYNPRKKTRKVKLTGEAFFDVKHEEEKPFIIETEEVLIKDLGTTFNVKAYPESNNVEVIVETGEVQIYTLSDEGIILKAGEKGFYDKTLKAFSKIEKIDTNGLAYKTKVFSFNNTDLQSVVEMLNQVYDSKITLANKTLSNCHVTVNFNNDNLDLVVEILSETLALKVTRSGDEIFLDGKGCQ